MLSYYCNNHMIIFKHMLLLLSSLLFILQELFLHIKNFWFQQKTTISQFFEVSSQQKVSFLGYNIIPWYVPNDLLERDPPILCQLNDSYHIDQVSDRKSFFLLMVSVYVKNCAILSRVKGKQIQSLKLLELPSKKADLLLSAN